jgi:hypothetical protein
MAASRAAVRFSPLAVPRWSPVFEVLTMSKAKDPNVPAKKPRKTEAAFDMWLQRGLHEIYDNVTNEPIPDELLKLIEEDRKR